ncbi:MAG: polysaccharide deacetylase family protein [Solirubrobacterales bacterium]|nr:polysaccharide deacetylase family protein [Solirubrobacterales bacterium]
MAVVDGFGPDRLPSALVVTFDNLGEASALERGTQPPDMPLGRDSSVLEALPWLLDELDRHRLTATFFVEAINCELYPDAVREIAARGHEVGHHGWAHEKWTSLPPETERAALTRGVRAFEALGLRPRGFRPPGGALSTRSPTLLRENGFDWCSPEGSEAVVDGGLAYIPFDWDLVDAYHLMDSFASLRVERGDPEAPLDPDALAAQFEQRLIASRGRQTLILHPFLMLNPAWSTGVDRVLTVIADLAKGRRTWVVPGNVFADWQIARS